jgi:hypothetical protein
MQHFQNWQSKQQARKTTSTHFAKQKLEFKKKLNSCKKRQNEKIHYSHIPKQR